MSFILGIETSGDKAECALGKNNDGTVEILGQAESSEPKKHCENLLPLISKVLADAGVEMSSLDLIVVDVGPGLYTGLRVGIATAMFLAYGLGIKTYGFSSSELVAHQEKSAETLLHLSADLTPDDYLPPEKLEPIYE